MSAGPAQEPTPAQRLADFTAELAWDAVPQAVRAGIEERLIDTLAVALAATTTAAVTAVRGLVEEWGGRPQAGVVGEPRSLPSASAALVNGTLAHVFDFDDTMLPSGIRPSATLVPAVLAQAQALGASGIEVVTALAAGYEVVARLGEAQFDARRRTSTMSARGLDATAILGAVSGAAACARLLHLDGRRTVDAISIAAGMAAGLLESNEGFGRPIQCGWAAHAAVSAAGLAAGGLAGPPGGLAGRFGLLPALCGDRWTEAALTASLGSRWDQLGIHIKPYPCHPFTHALVDAALALRRRGLRDRDVASVRIGAAAPMVRLIGEPIDVKRRPLTSRQAQLSGPFVFAAALAGGGGLGIDRDDFAEARLKDPRVIAVARACEVVVDPECEARFPYSLAASIRVRTRQGGELAERVLDNRGGPQRPLGREELLAKAEANAGDRARILAWRVGELAGARRVDTLVEA